MQTVYRMYYFSTKHNNSRFSCIPNAHTNGPTFPNFLVEICRQPHVYYNKFSVTYFITTNTTAYSCTELWLIKRCLHMNLLLPFHPPQLTKLWYLTLNLFRMLISGCCERPELKRRESSWILLFLYFIPVLLATWFSSPIRSSTL